MKKLILTLVAIAAFLALAPAALADPFDYNFSSSDTSVSMSVEFTANNLGGDVYQITNLTGVFTDTNNSILTQTIVDMDAGGCLNISADGLFVYDNLLSPDGGAPGFFGSVLDVNGVVFDLADGYEVSFFGATGDSYWAYESPDGINVITPAYLQNEAPVTTTPEPSSFLLLGSGLLALIAFATRKAMGKGMTVGYRTI